MLLLVNLFCINFSKKKIITLFVSLIMDFQVSFFSSSVKFWLYLNLFLASFPLNVIFANNIYLHNQKLDEDRIIEEHKQCLIWAPIPLLTYDFLIQIKRAFPLFLFNTWNYFFLVQYDNLQMGLSCTWSYCDFDKFRWDKRFCWKLYNSCLFVFET